MDLVKSSLSDQIYKVLKTEILERKVPFGSKLTNRALQERFDVSSSPVRDAINRLFMDGLVSKITRSGAVVADFDLSFFVEVNEILLCIAAVGVKFSGNKGNIRKIVPQLEASIALQEEHRHSDRYYEHDYIFHGIFIANAKNIRLEKLFNQYHALHEVLVRHYYTISGVKDSRLKSIAAHKEITGYFAKGDIKKAAELMEDHYRQADEIFRQMYSMQERMKRSQNL